MTQEYPEKYLQGLDLFNRREFFECHDVLEELWSEVQGGERRFYQGLIQAAVALFHFGNQNYGGARKLYGASRTKLQEYKSPFMGMDLDRFLADFQVCFQELLDAETYPTGLIFDPESAPRIVLQPVGRKRESQDQSVV